jgi:hypothetical protein
MDAEEDKWIDDVSKAGYPPMKQDQNPVFQQVIIMLMGIFGQAAFRLCERACHYNSACCRTTVDGKGD